MVLTPYDKLIVVSNGSGFHIPVPTQSLVMTENTFPKYMFFMFSKKILSPLIRLAYDIRSL